MLRILRYSPRATTEIVQREQSHGIKTAQSGNSCIIGFSVTEKGPRTNEKGGSDEPPQGNGGMDTSHQIV